VVVCILLSIVSPLAAQSVLNPTTAAFTASTDHNTILQNGSPAVSRYELEFYLSGATAPFQTLPFGKPSPDGTGTIRVNFVTLPGASFPFGQTYTADVVAVGPGGRGTSTMSPDTFAFTGSCTYAVSPTSANVPAGGSAGSVTVTAGTGCGWSATSSASWLTVTGGANGSGNGTVSYTVTANSASSSRSATLTVAGKSVTVAQAGVSCTYTLSSMTVRVAPAGGSASVSVTTPAGCGWTATSSAAWLTVTSGASGTGNGAVTVTAAANSAASARTATLTIAGQAVAATQQVLGLPTAPQNLRFQ